MSESGFGSIKFDLPKNQSNVIKVIGVGGGGSNAINHMFKQGIKGVDFIVCNTDSQALQNSPVPNKIQLGLNLTEGMGAGANPEVGQQSAIESVLEIESMLDTNTKMVFITAGMGGGTGTGAAPVIAQLAKEREILTVGIVTIPFLFEGKVRQEQALIGIEKLRKQVDSLIVINNNKLREVYGNLGFKAGFSKADEVLATASRGIAEVITHHYTQNIDLRDAKTVLANSGTAIMGSAIAEGSDRSRQAIGAALDSPLLNDNKIKGAKNVLLLIVSGEDEITLDEIGEINDYIQAEAGFNANIIMGVGEDESLGQSIAVTVIATGFDIEQQNDIVNTEPKKIIHTLEDDQKSVINLSNGKGFTIDTAIETVPKTENELPLFEITNSVISQSNLIPTTDEIRNIEIEFEIVEAFNSKSNDVKVNFIQAQPEQKEVFHNAILFDFPNRKDVDKIKIDATTQDIFSIVNEIEVNEAIEVKPAEAKSVDTSNEIIKYSLEEYMDAEESLLNSKPKSKTIELEEEVEIQMSVRQLETPIDDATDYQIDASPIEMTIEETLKRKAQERRDRLKEFNHKFHHASSRFDEIEKEPAYKRQGIDLTEPKTSNPNSRISVSTDSNNETQLRTNNSFLHDNVD
jgi:cell division protein FtsZ